MKSALEKVDFDKYQELLSWLLPDALGLGICNESGDLIWTSAERFPSDEFKPIETPESCHTDSTIILSLTDVASAKFGDGYRYWYLPVMNDQYDVAGFVGFAVPEGTLDAKAAKPALVHLTELIRSEFLLTAELESMSDELADRYEELNLVYHTEDKIIQYSDGLVALEELVKKCCDSMNVPLAVLVLRDKRIELHAESDYHKLDDRNHVVDQLVNVMYDWVSVQGTHLIANSKEDFSKHGLLTDLDCNIICAPVFEGGTEICGMLALVNHPNARPFHNSDKNLLTVLCNKVARILNASYDPLTGLIRRGGFEEFLDQAISQDSEHHHCMLHIDIDQMQMINDTLGHEGGDHVVSQIAKSLHSFAPDPRLLARINGDVFVLLLEKHTLRRAKPIASFIRYAISNLELAWAGRPLDVTVSVGLFEIDPAVEDVDAAMTSAQLACDEAKDRGGNRVQIYRGEDETLNRRRGELHMVSHVRDALQNDRFTLLCQKIQPLADGDDSVHFEVLLRMHDVKGGLLSPVTFIPTAERYHLMPFIDRWVIEHTIAALGRAWHDGAGQPGICAINLSGQSLTDSEFLKVITDALKEHRVPPQRICFEITETAAISNIEGAKTLMRKLKKLGCEFALDDFGAGLSSFGYLKELDVDYLKIDGKFVSDLGEDEISESMVRAMYHVGKSMGLKTVAEYVKNEDILERIRSIGLDYAQGFGIEKPRPLEDLIVELAKVRKVVAV